MNVSLLRVPVKPDSVPTDGNVVTRNIRSNIPHVELILTEDGAIIDDINNSSNKYAFEHNYNSMGSGLIGYSFESQWGATTTEWQGGKLSRKKSKTQKKLRFQKRNKTNKRKMSIKHKKRIQVKKGHKKTSKK